MEGSYLHAWWSVDSIEGIERSSEEGGRVRWNERKRRGCTRRAESGYCPDLYGHIRTLVVCALNETREGYPCKGIPQDLVNRSKGATVCYPSKETKKEEKRNGEEVEKCADSRFLSLPTKRGTGLRVLEQSSFDQWGIRKRKRFKTNEWINKFRYCQISRDENW